MLETKEIEANYSKFLGNASLKKEKLTVQVPKRAQEIEHPAAMSKKKKKELAQKQKKLEAKKESVSANAEEEKAEILYHHPEVLRNFELINIAPPNTQGEIDKIVESLEEKHKHFDGMRDQEPPVEEKTTEGENQEASEEKAQENRRVLFF